MLIENSGPIKELDLKNAKHENLERTALSYVYVVILVLFISNENNNENMELLKGKQKLRDETHFSFYEWFYEMKNRLSSLKKEIFGW